MPSACLKPEKKAPMEAEDAMKQCIVVVDKKVRNLEKRKGKLESYQEKSRKGDILNEDQKEAITNYDSVLRNLEFARELQKQFSEIQERAEKLLKKRAKFEKQDRHNEEVARIQELLQVQSLLDSMGAEEVREDFKAGNKGAVTLSEESLNQLDELYKLISPSRDGEQSYTSQLTEAAEHIVNFLDAKDKEVAGTTYKNLKDLIRQINECGYFEKNGAEEEQVTAEQTEDTEPNTEETEGPTDELPVDQEELGVGVAEVTHHTSLPSQQQPPAPATPTTTTTEQPQQQPPTSQIHTAPELLPNSLQPSHTQEVYQEDQVPVMARPRAFPEILSAVQGSFDFLQDSEIDTQQKAKKSQEVLHVDPAVVAAHTLTSGSLHAATDPLSQSFGSAAAPTNTFLEEQQQPAQYQQSTKNQSVTESSLSQSQGFSDALAAPTQPQSSQFGQSSTFEADIESKWGQGIYLPTSTSESVERSWGEQSSSAGTGNAGAPSSQSWGEQSHTPSWSTGTTQGPPDQQQQSTSTVADPPAPIPMPPSQTTLTNTAQPFTGAPQENETKSSLNPNADIFSSMYTNQSGSFPQDGGVNEFETSNQASNKQDRFGQSDMSGSYQSQGYRGRRDYDNRSGPRGGRGGPRGMTNGYGGRGNSRGGGSYRGDDRRGGPRGGRGGPSFQGYQPRSSYQPEGHHQGSTSSSFSHEHSGAGFTNKWGGQRGGGMRGGNRGGNGPRGSNRGNYSRPTSAHNQ